MSWVLHRIDDRLIHGQVVVAWGQRLNPQRIWVVDDASASGAWERELLSSSAPGIDVRVVTVTDVVPVAVGVPETTPVFVSRERPAGSAVDVKV